MARCGRCGGRLRVLRVREVEVGVGSLRRRLQLGPAWQGTCVGSCVAFWRGF